MSVGGSRFMRSSSAGEDMKEAASSAPEADWARVCADAGIWAEEAGGSEGRASTRASRQECAIHEMEGRGSSDPGIA